MYTCMCVHVKFCVFMYGCSTPFAVFTTVSLFSPSSRSDNSNHSTPILIY